MEKYGTQNQYFNNRETKKDPKVFFVNGLPPLHRICRHTFSRLIAITGEVATGLLPNRLNHIGIRARKAHFFKSLKHLLKYFKYDLMLDNLRLLSFSKSL